MTSPLRWRVARLAGARDETASARTLVLDVPGWPGHLPGQHVDIRLTAADGYTAQRSYSLAAPASGERVETTVQLVAGGEVSPFLVRDFALGDPVEVRGPVGGWFVWQPGPDSDPVLLAGGGSGIVPLMAMLRARRAAGSTVPFRLLYSVRSDADAYYSDELRRAGSPGGHSPGGHNGLDVTFIHTRTAPAGTARAAHRIDAADLAAHGWAAELRPRCYVCGPTGFVEAVADLLVGLGHDPARIRTERFGPSGG